MVYYYVTAYDTTLQYTPTPAVITSYNYHTTPSPDWIKFDTSVPTTYSLSPNTPILATNSTSITLDAS
jgi:hypothetical protein